MLEYAISHKDELNKLFVAFLSSNRDKFYTLNNWNNLEIDIKKSTWEQIQMVSVKNNKIIGYYEAYVTRSVDFIDSLAIINFGKPCVQFSKDLHSFISLLFTKFNMKKVCFTCLVHKQNPNVKLYEKICKTFGGQLIGTRKKHCRVGKELIDQYIYEIMYEEFKFSIKKK